VEALDPTRPEPVLRPAIRLAQPGEVAEVCSILLEAAAWLEGRGTPGWQPDELAPDLVEPDVAGGLFFFACSDGEFAGTFKFQLTDHEYWPEVGDDSAFVHRLAVRRKFAGLGISSAMLEWAASRARSLGRMYLRLDCDPRRPRLRAFYERHGFVHHSDVRVTTKQGRVLDAARYELRLEPPDQ
jgi:GNAT superfamily N-acetyltransferase